MGPKTNEQLTADVQQLRNAVEALQSQIATLTQQVNSKTKASDLSRSESNLDAKIKNNSELINKLEQQLSKVILPDDPRYYLSESEISNFRSNFNKLLAVMSSFEQLYKNLVAYSVKNVTVT